MMKQLFLVSCLLVYSVFCSTNVVIKHNKLFVNGVEFCIKGINYNPIPLGITPMDGAGYGGGGFCSPKRTPWGEWKSGCFDSDFFDGAPDIDGKWPNDGFAALWRRDFPAIRDMGVNTLRLYNTNPTTRQMSKIYPKSFIFLEQGKDHVPFLDMAKQYGFYVIFPLISDWWTFQTASESDFKRLLRSQIDEVGNHSAVLMWQFGNEMNWDGTKLGFYPYPDLMAKYNNYVQYIRQYTLSRWGRKIPITHAVIDFPQTFDWLLKNFDLEILSLNTFRGVGTYTIFPGDSNTRGFAYGTCAWNKPLLISEFGWNGYSSGYANQIISDFTTRINQGLIGFVSFEHNDEQVPQKPAGQRTFGAMSVSVSSNGTHTSMDEYAFLPDTMTKKQLYYDLSGGQYNNIAYNYNSDVYALAGRPAQTIASSVDYCTSRGTFTDCPGNNTCSGHGICARETGTCTCATGWSGVDCATPVCFCSGRGNCSILTSPPQCVCNNGYYGAQCKNVVVATQCPNDCTENKNGICNTTTKKCACVSGWTGPDCSVVTIAKPFPTLGVTRILYPSTPVVLPKCVGPIGEGQTLSVSCPTSQAISSVQFASYGTPTGSCGSLAISSCHATTSTNVFSTNCLNKNSCSFTVGNAAFTDPCSGTIKNFYAQYTCSNVATVCSTVQEHSTMSLSCPLPAQKITSVQFASYGTPSGSCGSFAKGSCDSATSLSTLNSNCLNKNSCTIAAQNSVFTDPCTGTSKNLRVQVICS